MIRDYQQRGIDALRSALGESNRVLYQLPTGAGKTVVAGEICRLMEAKGKSALLLVHRRELIDQTVETLRTAIPAAQPGIIASGYVPIPWSRFQIASIQTLHRRENLRFNFDLIFVDEAHHARADTWEKVIRRWPNAKLIGLTATPTRNDNKGLGTLFEMIVRGPQPRELIAAGHLAPVRVLAPVGDFGEADGNPRGEQATTIATAASVQNYLRYAKGTQAIFFGKNREHSKSVAASMKSHGIAAEHLDAETDKGWRDEAMRRFRERELRMICNVDLISEGVDAPACETIMMGRPTQSVAVYLQQAGRAMRPGLGKTALILDLVRNCYNPELGLPDDDREWTLDADSGSGCFTNSAASASRACEKCFTVYRRTLSQCPICQAQPSKSILIKEHDLMMGEVRASDIKAKRKAEREKPAPARRMSQQQAWALAYKSGGDKDQLAWIEQVQNYKPGWRYFAAKRIAERNQK